MQVDPNAGIAIKGINRLRIVTMAQHLILEESALPRCSSMTAAPNLSVRSSRQSSSRQPREVLRWTGNAALGFAAFAMAALASEAVSAQQAESTYQPVYRVALIDVAYVLENLPAIKAHAAKVEAESKRRQAKLEKRRGPLTQAVKRLKTLKRNSAEYAEQEEHVAKLESELRAPRIFRDGRRSDAEVKLYYDNYLRIAAAVRAVAKRNRINLVLPFDREGIDPKQNDSVARGVRRNVVYHDRKIDITSTVMQYLEKRSTPSHSTTSGDASPADSR